MKCFKLWDVQWVKRKYKEPRMDTNKHELSYENIHIYSCLFVVKIKHEEPLMDTNKHELSYEKYSCLFVSIRG